MWCVPVYEVIQQQYTFEEIQVTAADVVLNLGDAAMTQQCVQCVLCMVSMLCAVFTCRYAFDLCRKSTGALADLYSQKQRGTRETLFEDRTYCHADQVAEDGGDGGIGRHTTCAVGVLKAVTRRGK